VASRLWLLLGSVEDRAAGLDFLKQLADRI
jgi:hypothetical protein